MKKFLLAQIVFCAFAFSANSQNLLLNSDMNGGTANWDGGTCGFPNVVEAGYTEDFYGGPDNTNAVAEVEFTSCLHQTVNINVSTTYKVTFKAQRRITCGGAPGACPTLNPVSMTVSVIGVTSGTVYSTVNYNYTNTTWAFTTENQIFTTGITDAQVYLSFTPLGNLDDIGVVLDDITMQVNSVLPINLVSFNTVAKNGAVDLSWATNNEVNSNYFTVYRSKNGVDFTEIGKVNASGLSNGSVYSLTDAQPSNGINYYKLKLVDKNGAFKYSNIVKANLGSLVKTLDVMVYPSIVSSSLNYIVESPKAEKLQVTVSDISGKRVNSSIQSFTNGTTQKTINVSNLASGVYLLTVADETGAFKKSVTFKKN